MLFRVRGLPLSPGAWLVAPTVGAPSGIIASASLSFGAYIISLSRTFHSLVVTMNRLLSSSILKKNHRFVTTVSNKLWVNQKSKVIANSFRSLSAFKDEYDGAVAERALVGIVPKALDAGKR